MQLAFLVPGPLDAPTGGSIYDRRMIEGLRARGYQVHVRALDSSFPFPSAAARAHTADVCAAIPDGTTVIVDGLAFGAVPDIVEQHAGRLRFVALVHLPLAADIGIDGATAARLEAAERRSLAAAALVVVTGKAALALLQRYDVPAEKIAIVEPGTEVPGRSDRPLRTTATSVEAGLQTGLPVRLLCVATLNPGKGHEILLRALADVPTGSWHLTCLGSLTRHRAAADRVAAVVRELRLDRNVTLIGEIGGPELARYWDDADVFVLATLRETYGMAVAEAIAHGLPVVSTKTGAIPALVPEDAGVLVEPGDGSALSASLARIIGDASLRGRLSEGARRAATRLPSWEAAAKKMAATLERIPVTHG